MGKRRISHLPGSEKMKIKIDKTQFVQLLFRLDSFSDQLIEEGKHNKKVVAELRKEYLLERGDEE